MEEEAWISDELAAAGSGSSSQPAAVGLRCELCGKSPEKDHSRVWEQNVDKNRAALFQRVLALNASRVLGALEQSVCGPPVEELVCFGEAGLGLLRSVASGRQVYVISVPPLVSKGKSANLEGDKFSQPFDILSRGSVANVA